MNKSTYKMLRALGMCTRYGCGELAESGKAMCKTHAEEHRAYNRKWKAGWYAKTKSEEWRRVWRKTAA